jgi:hypothetical protein
MAGLYDSKRRTKSDDADALVWNLAFVPGTWTLQAIIDHSRKSDFGLFIMALDAIRRDLLGRPSRSHGSNPQDGELHRTFCRKQTLGDDEKHIIRAF